jgi:hypothetical protein
MNFCFLSLDFGTCYARIWATGRYGFALPKKVEITLPTGERFTYLYYNRKAGLRNELTNVGIVRIAIAQFLAAPPPDAEPELLDEALAPFVGALKPVRGPGRSASLRVRPGKSYARPAENSEPPELKQ